MQRASDSNTVLLRTKSSKALRKRSLRKRSATAMFSLFRGKLFGGKDLVKGIGRKMVGGPSPPPYLVKCPKCRKVLQEPEDVPVYKCGSCNAVLQAKSRKPEAKETKEYGNLIPEAIPLPFGDSLSRNNKMVQDSSMDSTAEHAIASRPLDKEEQVEYRGFDDPVSGDTLESREFVHPSPDIRSHGYKSPVNKTVSFFSPKGIPRRGKSPINFDSEMRVEARSSPYASPHEKHYGSREREEVPDRHGMQTRHIRTQKRDKCQSPIPGYSRNLQRDKCQSPFPGYSNNLYPSPTHQSPSHFNQSDEFHCRSCFDILQSPLYTGQNHTVVPRTVPRCCQNGFTPEARSMMPHPGVHLESPCQVGHSFSPRHPQAWHYPGQSPMHTLHAGHYMDHEYPMSSPMMESYTQRRDRDVKKYVNERIPVVKQHLRPTAGGAPFTTCYYCLEPLQLPEDLPVSKGKSHLIRCGACSGILRFRNKTPKAPSRQHTQGLPKGHRRIGNVDNSNVLSSSSEDGVYICGRSLVLGDSVSSESLLDLEEHAYAIKTSQCSSDIEDGAFRCQDENSMEIIESGMSRLGNHLHHSQGDPERSRELLKSREKIEKLAKVSLEQCQIGHGRSTGTLEFADSVEEGSCISLDPTQNEQEDASKGAIESSEAAKNPGFHPKDTWKKLGELPESNEEKDKWRVLLEEYENEHANCNELVQSSHAARQVSEFLLEPSCNAYESSREALMSDESAGETSVEARLESHPEQPQRNSEDLMLESGVTVKKLLVLKLDKPQFKPGDPKGTYEPGEKTKEGSFLDPEQLRDHKNLGRTVEPGRATQGKSDFQSEQSRDVKGMVVRKLPVLKPQREPEDLRRTFESCETNKEGSGFDSKQPQDHKNPAKRLEGGQITQEKLNVHPEQSQGVEEVAVKKLLVLRLEQPQSEPDDPRGTFEWGEKTGEGSGFHSEQSQDLKDPGDTLKRGRTTQEKSDSRSVQFQEVPESLNKTTEGGETTMKTSDSHLGLGQLLTNSENSRKTVEPASASQCSDSPEVCFPVPQASRSPIRSPVVSPCGSPLHPSFHCLLGYSSATQLEDISSPRPAVVVSSRAIQMPKAP